MKLDVVKILKDMVRLNTTNPDGNEYLLTDYIGKLLKEHNISYEVIEPEKGRCSIVASIGLSSDQVPLAFISHLDVVPADAKDWQYDPFSATEVDGMIYGRGTLDTKFLTAVSLVTFVTLSKEPLDREILFIATADEEKGSRFGMPHVAKSYGDKLKNAYIINEGGGFYIENGKDQYYLCTVGEKGRCDVKVTVEGRPSASSFPNDDKSTHKFMAVLDKLHAYEFPYEPGPVYDRFISLFKDEIDNTFLKDFKTYNGQNKIILSEYSAGDAINLMPKTIIFDFSLQLLPSKTIEDAKEILADMFEGLDAHYEITEFIQGFESDCNSPCFNGLEKMVKTYFCEDASLLPVYALGRTDGRFLGNLPANVYGCSLITPEIPFEQVIKLVHNIDEKIDVESLKQGVKAYIGLYRQLGGKCEK